MLHDIEILNPAATITAVIRSRVPAKELARFIPAACGEVWSFIRSAKVARPGRQLALYLDSGSVEVGAEVGEPFTDSPRVVCSRLPGGRAAHATHFGPYGRLAESHAAIRQWCGEQGQRVTGVSWELYGHWEESWNSDAAKIRTDVFYQLEPQNG